MSVVRSTVRYNKELGEFELRCESCAALGNVAAYWPLSLDFWDPARSMKRCRSCAMEADRKAHREYRRREGVRARERNNTRSWRERNPTYNAEYARIRKSLDPDAVKRANRDYYYRNHDRIRAQQAEHRARLKALREEAA